MHPNHVVPVHPSRGAQSPVSASDVTLTDGFWFTRERLNTEKLLDHADRWITSMGWYDAFRVAAGGERTIPMQGKLFTDADVYKLLEGMVWEVAVRPDDVREARIQEISELIAAAQEDDGYLNTFFGPQGKDARYRDLSHGHELYCAGHLFQAAAARMRAGHDDALTRAAIRFADRLCEDFGPTGIDGSDGHPEIEVGFIELGRAANRPDYIAQAKRFIDGRGRGRFQHHAIGHEYYVDDLPVREADVLRGHVVRAMYLTAAVVDLAVETGDDELLSIVETQWTNTWGKRTYLTGGMGSRHLGESFGADFELPPDRAYTETCGAVGAIMVAWRLLLATGKATYADAIERLLFNMIATHPSADGDRIFYVNPLLRREPGIEVDAGVAPFRKDTLRANWFWVACCPTNVVRLLASLDSYFVTTTDHALTVQQFFGGDIATELGDGREVGIRLDTEYPWDGLVSATITRTTGRWSLRMRVPEWADGATIAVNGESRNVSSGYAEVDREWSEGDIVELRLPMRVRVNRADTRINALRDTLAVERGPLVYAAESIVSEPDAVDLDRFTADAAIAPVEHAVAGPSDSRIRIAVDGTLIEAEPRPAAPWPYRDGVAAPTTERASAELVPYYAWSNRGPSTMRVWLPTTPPPADSAGHRKESK